MSWSSSVGPVAKDEIDPTVPATSDVVEAEQREQFEAAKEAAAVLAKAVGREGDDVFVTLSGHANPGHGPRQGWAAESVTISVTARPSE